MGFLIKEGRKVLGWRGRKNIKKRESEDFIKWIIGEEIGVNIGNRYWRFIKLSIDWKINASDKRVRVGLRGRREIKNRSLN